MNRGDIKHALEKHFLFSSGGSGSPEHFISCLSTVLYHVPIKPEAIWFQSVEAILT